MKSPFLFVFVALAQGISPVARGDVPGTNALDPGVPLGTNELKSVLQAGSNSLASFRVHITSSNYQLLGFNSLNEVVTATNGDPLMSFKVGINQLTNYQAGADFNSLMVPRPVPGAFIPVLVGTNVRSSTTLRYAQGPAGRWLGGDWGHPKVIRSLINTYGAITNTELLPGTIPFAVQIPIPRTWFVGYYNTQQKLVLRSTIDLHLGPITINRNQALTQAAMDLMANEARRYDPNLPN